MMISISRDQRGVTLVELMISLTIGLVIIAGIAQVFLAGKRTSGLQERLSVLQENGRYALYFLQRDIRDAGSPLYQTFNAFPNLANSDGGGNNPDTITISYRWIQAINGADCLGNPILPNAQVVTTYSIVVDGPTGVSRLMCSAQGAAQQPIVDGIENMQVLYGIDSNSDTYADIYLPAGAAAAAIAAAVPPATIVAIRVSVLASAIEPVSGDLDTDNTGTFVLLDAPPFGPLQKFFPAPGGPLRNIRGRVFTTTVEVRNRTS